MPSLMAPVHFEVSELNLSDGTQTSRLNKSDLRKLFSDTMAYLQFAYICKRLYLLQFILIYQEVGL